MYAINLIEMIADFCKKKRILVNNRLIHFLVFFLQKLLINNEILSRYDDFQYTKNGLHSLKLDAEMQRYIDKNRDSFQLQESEEYISALEDIYDKILKYARSCNSYNTIELYSFALYLIAAGVEISDNFPVWAKKHVGTTSSLEKFYLAYQQIWQLIGLYKFRSICKKCADNCYLLGEYPPVEFFPRADGKYQVFCYRISCRNNKFVSDTRNPVILDKEEKKIWEGRNVKKEQKQGVF